MPLDQGSRLGAYQILGPLGAGGMGEVYRARDLKLGRDVALKVLSAAFARDANRMRRFVQEARAASALNHPNIVTIYEIDESETGHFIATEYIEGVTLRQRIRSGPAKLDEVLDIAVQIAGALSAAHTAGVIHRDVKPENIMVRPDGIAKVLDFGLAKLDVKGPAAGGAESSPTKSIGTEPGTVMGTVAYMSPEQARGIELDARTDIWSLGAVLYEMLTLRPPFSGNTMSDKLVSILEKEPEPLARYASGAPAELERIVRKALVKDCEERYQTARDLWIDLKSLRRALDMQSSAGVTVVPETVPGPAATGQKPKYRVAPLLLALAAILTTVLLVVFRGSRGEGTPGDRALARLTFDPGLQSEPTWSPDGRFIAYSSDRGGKSDVWVQPAGEGNPILVTHSAGHNWQPDWSPDGASIVFRSEREGGGLYLIPALGGNERKLSPFGSHPRWSRDGSSILFDTQVVSLGAVPKLYTVKLDGNPPREILRDFFSDFATLGGGHVTWHPDGERVSVWAVHRKLGRGFWTVPIDGRPAVKSEVSPDVERRIGEASLTLGAFLWSPSGRELYFEGVSRGVSNLWKIAVDPKTLRWSGGPERLTTGPGEDSNIRLSPDGKKLAFCTRTEATRTWVFPFDAMKGQLKGEGKPETPAGMNSWTSALSPDGSRLLYFALRPNRTELWMKLLDEGSDRLLVAADERRRNHPCWSRDGLRVAYRRSDPPRPDNLPGGSIVILPLGGGEEQQITSNGIADGPRSWFGDGKRILALTTRPDGKRWKIWIVSTAFAPHAENQAEILASDENANFFQPALSPDEHWICFMKVKADEAGLSTLFVMPASGGEMTPITDGKFYDDKVRWSPDGRTIYFLSPRGGFFNVWGIHFDPVHGSSLGQPFRVTAFENPSRMATPTNQTSEISVSANRLALPLTELSGGIWVLENVDR